MNSILYDYFLPKVICFLMMSIVGYYIYKKEISKWSLLLYIPISLFLIVTSFSGPSIFNNIEVYEKLYSLKAENVMQINVFEQSNTGAVYEAIPYSSFIIKERSKIAFILNRLKQNKAFSENMGQIKKTYGMRIILADKSKIDFTIHKSAKSIYPKLLNEYNGRYYVIGSYKNSDLRNIFN